MGIEQSYPFNLSKSFMVNPLMSTIKLARFKFVSKMLSQKDTVLDLGCGNGLSSYYYSKFCKSVHGVDIQDAVSDSWKTLKTPNITFSQADILTPHAYIYIMQVQLHA